jgi:uncharacterized phage-associated protein
MNFQVDKDKTIEALLYIVHRYGEVGRFHALKTLYFADLQHLRAYGRPVTGDRYIAMENGPVPSYAYSALKQTLPEHERQIVVNALTVETDRPRPYYRPHREPDMRFFSKTDIECLDWAYNHCRRRSFGAISDETHEHPGWKKAELNGDMSIEDMLEDADPSTAEDARLFASYGVL